MRKEDSIFCYLHTFVRREPSTGRGVANAVGAEWVQLRPGERKVTQLVVMPSWRASWILYFPVPDLKRHKQCPVCRQKLPRKELLEHVIRAHIVAPYERRTKHSKAPSGSAMNMTGELIKQSN